MSVPSQISLKKNIITSAGMLFADDIFYQLEPDELVAQTLEKHQGVKSDTGALVINTGHFTGRSPNDKFIVRDNLTEHSIDWNNFNHPIDENYFDRIHKKMLGYFSSREVWVRDCFACADEAYRLSIRVINDNPWSNLFAYNMLLRPNAAELKTFKPKWTVLHAPGFTAEPEIDGVPNENFAIINFTKKLVLIGGTGYTGEIKKGIFTILNFLMPQNHNVLPMHCSANIGAAGDTAIFFGLSGTGKTTLSTHPQRKLIGDDEHGWAANSIFNFEGGCYAKTINLDKNKEPEIFNAIKDGALVENVTFYEDSNTIDFSSKQITENTRVSYPVDFIPNAAKPSVGNVPDNIFFLTADAYGVLPPISKLDAGQAMYHFLTGYTAKVAGTEAGVKEPQATFSACFGAPFMPLHPVRYAKMLGEKLKANSINVWLVNTGWIGGQYGTGKRIDLNYTRAMINAALDGKLNEIAYTTHPIFSLQMPLSCPGVPSEILNPENTWSDKEQYQKTARFIAKHFIRNFEKYAAEASPEILNAAPTV